MTKREKAPISTKALPSGPFSQLLESLNAEHGDELAALLLAGSQRKRAATAEKSKRKLSPEIELLLKALRIAGSSERLAEWMRTPLTALNGQAPYGLMESEDGRKQVDAVLGRIEHGVY